MSDEFDGARASRAGTRALRRGTRRGFIFAIDATLAFFLMVFMLLMLTYFSYQAEQSQYAKLQAARVAKDVMLVMDAQGALGSGNRSMIELALNRTLPAGYGAHISVSTYQKDVGGFNLVDIAEYGQALPNSTAIFGARHDFTGSVNGRVANYSTARMSIWRE